MNPQYAQLQIVKSFTKDVPYRIFKGDRDYTPKRLNHRKFNEIKGAFDLPDFISLFVCENFIPTNYPILLNEDRSSLITGLLTGSRYGPSTFPLKTILRKEPPVGSKKKKVDKEDVIEREFLTPFVDESFRVLLTETKTVSLYSRETAVIVHEMEVEGVIKKAKPVQALASEEAGIEEEEEVEEEEKKEKADEVKQVKELGEEEEEEEDYFRQVPRPTLRYTKVEPPKPESSEEGEEIQIDIEALKLDEPFKDNGTNPEEPFYLEVAINTDNPIRKNRLIGVSPFTFHYDRPGVQIEELVTIPHQFVDPRDIKADYEDISTSVLDSPSFYLVFHSIEKLLEARYYKQYHRIFNNPSMLDDLPKDQKFASLFVFKQPKVLKPDEVSEVTCLAWHPTYKYLIGASYGKQHLEKEARGMFCMWNIKNPSYPERMYKFKRSVTCFSFSSIFPYAVALTFHNGEMMIINILARKLIKLCNNQQYMKDYLPMTSIKWFIGDKGDHYPVTASKSGQLYKFKVDKFLYPMLMLELPRAYGEQKGIKQFMRIFPGDEQVKPIKIGISTFTQHPKETWIYLVGTDDGFVHVCSKVFKMRDTDVFSAHEGPITNIEFHRETDKLFLTSGNDYYIRVWGFLVFTPLMSLSTKKELVRCAKWATFNTMQIVAMGEIYLDVWDLRRINNSIPISSYENVDRSNNLTFNMSTFGPHVVLGDEKGDINLLIYNDTKFEPPFKMEILAKAVRNHVKCRDPVLWRQVEQIVPELRVQSQEGDTLDILDDLDD